MTTVYVVTSGSYSDYRINQMFTTREKAQAYIDRLKDVRKWWDVNDIEEYELDTINEDWIAGKFDCWAVWFSAHSADVLSAEISEGNPQEDVSLFPAHNGRSPARIRVMVYAETQERAVKVAMERRAIFLANQEPQP